MRTSSQLSIDKSKHYNLIMECITFYVFDMEQLEHQTLKKKKSEFIALATIKKNYYTYKRHNGKERHNESNRKTQQIEPLHSDV